jgi:hypothetical protein
MFMSLYKIMRPNFKSSFRGVAAFKYFGMSATNPNHIREEIRAEYISLIFVILRFKIFFPPFMVFEIEQVKMYGAIFVPVCTCVMLKGKNRIDEGCVGNGILRRLCSKGKRTDWWQ